MKRLVFAIPGDLATATGGYIYDRRVIEALRQFGWQVEVLGLGDGFPNPDSATRRQAARDLLALERGVPIVVDGLAFGVLPEIAEKLHVSQPVIALVHHPLAFETGLTPEQVARLKDSESKALACATRVIVTSPATAKDVAQHFSISAEFIDCVLPGTDRFAQVTARAALGPLQLLSVGSVVKRKGFDVLLRALAELPELSWELTIAGDLTRDVESVEQLYAAVERFGFDSRVRILGAISSTELERLYLQADIFVLASRFEGYGMAYAEALAHGLPVIGTTAGAIPGTVPPTAGLLAEPGDVQSLTQALRRLLSDAELRERLARGARLAALEQPSWMDSAELFAQAIERACAQHVSIKTG